MRVLRSVLTPILGCAVVGGSGAYTNRHACGAADRQR